MNYLQNYIKLLLVLITFVSTLQQEVSKVKNLDWKDCGGANATVRWEDVRIHEPMRLKNLIVGAKYRILEEVRPGSKSKIEVWRIMKMLFVPVHIKIPCTHKFGSCDYDICRILDIDNFCNFQRQHNASCGCPMSPKLVEGYNFKVRVPDHKWSTFQTLFAEGLYKIKWTWFNPEGNRIGCLEGEGQLTPF